MTRKRFVVVGTLASSPCAGMAWMHMQIVVGLRRLLAHDADYFELISNWAYHRSHPDKAWLGMGHAKAEDSSPMPMIIGNQKLGGA